jgi:hypothetical protein
MVALIVIAGGWAARSAWSQQGVGKIMRQKLELSQQILEGVTTEDYRKITDATAPLIALTHRADWTTIDRPEYLGFSMEFRRTIEQLADAARRQSPDGVALGYVQMTMACVQCHRFVRDIRKI